MEGSIESQKKSPDIAKRLSAAETLRSSLATHIRDHLSQQKPEVEIKDAQELMVKLQSSIFTSKSLSEEGDKNETSRSLMQLNGVLKDVRELMQKRGWQEGGHGEFDAIAQDEFDKRKTN